MIKESHKAVLRTLCENVRPGKNGKKERITQQKALIDLGYSPSYAKTSNIKHTKSWKELMETYLPDKKLARVHQKLLNKKEIIVVDKQIKKTGQLHSDAKFALDMAYKLKSKFGETTINHKFGELSDAELEEELAKEIAELAKESDIPQLNA